MKRGLESRNRIDLYLETNPPGGVPNFFDTKAVICKDLFRTDRDGSHKVIKDGANVCAVRIQEWWVARHIPEYVLTILREKKDFNGHSWADGIKFQTALKEWEASLDIKRKKRIVLAEKASLLISEVIGKTTFISAAIVWLVTQNYDVLALGLASTVLAAGMGYLVDKKQLRERDRIYKAMDLNEKLSCLKAFEQGVNKIIPN